MARLACPKRAVTASLDLGENQALTDAPPNLFHTSITLFEQVYCLFPRANDTINKNLIRTIVGHDSHSRMLVQSDWPPSQARSLRPTARRPEPPRFDYTHSVVYDIGLQSIRALQSDSKSCWQFVHWHCSLGSPLLGPGSSPASGVSRLRSADGVWFDMPASCLIDGQPAARCDCAGGGKLLTFRITEKQQLPVQELLFRAVDRQLRGLHEVGAVQCQGDSDDIQAEFEDDCKDISNIEFFQCQSGQIIKAKYRCIFDHDQYGYQMGCRDVTQLRNCENYACSDDYVKCPDSYCIPPRSVGS